MIALLALLGCGPAPVRLDDVACQGLDLWPGSYVLGQSGRAVGLSDGTAAPACSVAFGTGTVAGDVAVTSGTTLGANEGWISLVEDGARWTSTSGTITLDDVDDAGATGSYDVVLADPSGDEATATGEFDLCNGAARGDCAGAPIDGYTKRMTVDSPALVGDAGLTDCRILADKATGGVQVDAEIGTWNGVSLIQDWSNECGPLSTPDLTGENRVTFRAGGYTGPGSYGPYRSTDFGGTQMPQLDLLYPYLVFQEPSLQCAETWWRDHIETVSGTSVCSWTLAEDRFVLDCDQIYDVISDPQSSDPRGIGHLHLDADCRIEER